MKKQIKILLLLAISLISSCKKEATKPLSEQIGKAWTAQTVREGSTVVYTKGAANNTKPAYDRFRLDLSSPAAARLTEFDGTAFAGTWELVNDKVLILKGLTPIPTGTTGSIEYSIQTASETELRITRSTASTKTGGTINDYTLN
jgi:hypothetical protein